MERQPRRRRRPALSCLECRRRKIKCDRNDPCAHCVSAKTQCTFTVYGNGPATEAHPQGRQLGTSWGSLSSPPADAPSPLAHVRPTSTNRSIAGQGNNPSRTRVAAPLAPPALSPPAPTAPTVPPVPPAPLENVTPNTSGHNDIRLPNHGQDPEPDLRDLWRRVQRLERSPASTSVNELSEAARDILTRQAGLQGSQIILNKTRILGWSQRMAEAHEFGPVVGCYVEACGHGDGSSFQGPETRELVAQMGSLLQKCKNIARSTKAGRPSRRLSRPGFGLAPPSREVADPMVTLYFRSFESSHRILHEPTFWADYRRYWNNPESITTDVLLKILLVIGMGSSLSDHGDKEPGFRNTVHQWIYAAQAWLSGPLEKDRLDTTGIQIHCLTVLARQIFSIGGDLVWMSMGSLVHRAMQIGLHRDPKHLPAISVLQAELRRRLWATILEMVVQSSLDSAMPPRIAFEEFDTEAPSNNNDDEMDESITELQPRSREVYTMTSMQLILLDSIPTRLRIVQLLNGLHTELYYTDVLALSSEITDACRACSAFLKKNEEAGVAPFHRDLLDYLLRRFLLPLHYPFARKARTNQLFYYSLKVSVDAALALISPEPDEAFSRLMAIGGGLFREGFRCASAAITTELINQVDAQRVDGTLHRNSRYIDLLKQAVRDMISSSTERMRQGETNIKGHMFFSMILAQVEAIEEGDLGDLGELKIAQSGRDSLEFSYGLLQTWAATASLPCPSDTGPPSTLGGNQEAYGLDFDFDFFLPDASFA